jgi:hypothetical protein
MIQINSKAKTATNLSTSATSTWSHSIKIASFSAIIDQVLNETSKHAISNAAVTTAINEILEKLNTINSNDQIKIVNCEKTELPIVGESNILYVSKKDNAFYIWDEENLHYVDFNTNQIDLINGGNSLNEY